jgi:hypothetical protein
MRLAHTLLPALCLLLGACSTSVDIPPVILSAEVTQEEIDGSVVPGTGGEELHFTLPLDVTNESDQSISTTACIWEIQELVGSTWKAVYSPGCFNADLEPLFLAGDETQSLELDVAAPLSTSVEDHWTGSGPGGTYRLVLGVLSGGARPRKVTGGETNPFVLSW